MKILVLSSLFPNEKQTKFGVFVKQEIEALSKISDLVVVAPVPLSLPIKGVKGFEVFSVPYKECCGNVRVYHPRFFVIPKVLRCLYGFLYFLGVFKTVKRISKSFDFDVIYSFYAYPDGFAAWLLSMLLKKKVVIKVLGSDINVYTRNLPRKFLTVLALNSANRVISVSRALEKRMIEIGVREDLIEVIPNGVDLEKFKPLEKNACRNKLALPAKKSIILFVGNLREVKGVDVLLDAFSEIVKRLQQECLLVYLGDGELRGLLEKRMKGLGLENLVSFVGQKEHDDIPSWICAADLLCLPSRQEGYPNILLEAMACNVPVVASCVGGIPEIVTSESQGVLVNPGDSQDLASGLIRVLNMFDKVEAREEKKVIRSWDDVAKETCTLMMLVLRKANLCSSLKAPFIYFSSDEWESGLRTSQYHIAVRLAKDHKVLYINSIGLRKPNVSKADFLRIIDKLKRCFEGIKRISSNLYVLTPLVIPFHGIKLVDRLNKLLLIYYVRYYQIRLGFKKPVILTFLPNTVNVFGRFGEQKVVYYCADQVSSFKGVDAEKIEEMEKSLLRRADCVFVTSKQLYEQKKNWNPKTFYLPHGVDTELFKLALDPLTEVPSDISSLKRPVIGFFGHVSRDWVDFEIVTFMAQKHPEWSIVLIGKVAADIPDISGYRNIVLLGSRDYSRLPGYSKCFDVAIIPFVDSQLTRNSNPLKLKEYLAAGRPVVSTPIPELTQFSSIIKISAKKEAFVSAVEDCLKNDSEEQRLKRSKLMDQETWDQKFNTFLECIH